MAKELTRKEKQITQLYIETLEEVSRNADNWISFLKEQVIIINISLMNKY